MERKSTLEKPLFFPAHPRVRQALDRLGLTVNTSPYVILSEPVSYTEMLVLEKNAKLIITDSGGVQKEAYFFKTPTVIPRSESEWVELVDAGWAVIAGAEPESIVQKALECWYLGKRVVWKPYYGEGKASNMVARILQQILEQKGEH